MPKILFTLLFFLASSFLLGTAPVQAEDGSPKYDELFPSWDPENKVTGVIGENVATGEKDLILDFLLI